MFSVFSSTWYDVWKSVFSILLLQDFSASKKGSSLESRCLLGVESQNWKILVDWLDFAGLWQRLNTNTDKRQILYEFTTNTQILLYKKRQILYKYQNNYLANTIKIPAQKIHKYQCTYYLTNMNGNTIHMQFIWSTDKLFRKIRLFCQPPPKSHAAIFFGLQRTSFWSN